MVVQLPLARLWVALFLDHLACSSIQVVPKPSHETYLAQPARQKTAEILWMSLRVIILIVTPLLLAEKVIRLVDVITYNPTQT
jgi:hypothetical protein